MSDFKGQIQSVSRQFETLRAEIKKRLVGQPEVESAILISLLTQGHILLEGLPGLAKTTALKALSEAAALSLSRIQFTPDLLPSDIVGTQIFNPKENDFIVKRGPIFANLVIADEINRAPAKVQSALLEAMQERHVSLGGETYPLPAPFFVMATQNPIEQSGTYPLPEAQLDRFLFKVCVDYVSKDEELEIMRTQSLSDRHEHLSKVISAEQISEAQKLLSKVYVSDEIRRYIVEIVFSTRPSFSDSKKIDLCRYLLVGASPRASLNFEVVAKAVALLDGRDYVVPDDVRAMAKPLLRHRLILNFEADAQRVTADHIVHQILETVPVA